MNKIPGSLSLLLVLSLTFLLQGCIKDKVTTTLIAYEPVYKSKAEVLQSINGNAARPLQQTGKIALYGNYIFVNEVNKGVHIIDNSNPVVPRNIAFINIPGNIDIAVRNNILYADIYTDMLAIDIANVNNVAVTKVNYNIFPERIYTGNFISDSSRYIVDWVKHETTEEREIKQARENINTGVWMEGDALSQSGNFSNTPANSSGGTKSNSIGGSMARFTLVNDYLYTVGRNSLSAFNVLNAANPVLENVTSLGWNIETVYSLNNKLFIGSQTGMFIYSIHNPASPSRLGDFSHACFDDPVIANDEYAFVTLKATGGESSCWGIAPPQQSQLDIIDINDLTRPMLIKTYSMEEPMGMSLDGNHLFLCDGKGGLKIYNTDDVNNIQLLRTINDIQPFDVITYHNRAIVVTKEGIVQYDYANINNIRKLSMIAIEK
jgi:hypothetical protein